MNYFTKMCVRTAVIWNTGPGMSRAELKVATDLACEIDKCLGLYPSLPMITMKACRS
jgi:hypothetical protein